MKKIVLVFSLVLLSLLTIENSVQIDPAISSLSGMEYAQGNTHLQSGDYIETKKMILMK